MHNIVSAALVLTAVYEFYDQASSFALVKVLPNIVMVSNTPTTNPTKATTYWI